MAEAADAELSAKNAAETAMRHWAFCSQRLGEVRMQLNVLREKWPESV